MAATRKTFSKGRAFPLYLGLPFICGFINYKFKLKFKLNSKFKLKLKLKLKSKAKFKLKSKAKFKFRPKSYNKPIIGGPTTIKTQGSMLGGINAINITSRNSNPIIPRPSRTIDGASKAHSDLQTTRNHSMSRNGSNQIFCTKNWCFQRHVTGGVVAR